MQIGNTFEATVQQAMALKSPEVLEALPTVEAMPREERIALVRRGYNTTDILIKNWDKMADIFAARGETRGQVKRRARNLKEARKNLDRALRLMNPKFIPPVFREKSEACFNVLAAWFIAHQDDLAAVYALPVVRRQDIGTVVAAALGSVDQPKANDAVYIEAADMADREVLLDGPSNARTVGEADFEDVLDVSGNSSVH